MESLLCFFFLIDVFVNFEKRKKNHRAIDLANLVDVAKHTIQEMRCREEDKGNKFLILV